MEPKSPRLAGDHHHPPVPQLQTVEILQSIERPVMTPIFGMPMPPSGLSGIVRHLALKYNESDVQHWMLLLLLLVAAHVNMHERPGSDLERGKIPNLYADMGGPAALKYDRHATLRKAAAASAVLLVDFLLVRQSHKKSRWSWY